MADYAYQPPNSPSTNLATIGVASSSSACLAAPVEIATDNFNYDGPSFSLDRGTYLVTLNLTLRI